jgi:ribosomal-protein-alanine N-acetyltransferase
MSVALRPVRSSDLAALAGIHAACFPDEAWDSGALATVLAMAGTAGQVAGSDAAGICGFLITQCLGEDAEILTLGVAPAHRRQGIARVLLVDFFARARAVGATRVVLEVAADNPPALALYQSLGFARLGTRPNYYRRAAGPAMDAWRLGLDFMPQN